MLPDCAFVKRAIIDRHDTALLRALFRRTVVGFKLGAQGAGATPVARAFNLIATSVFGYQFAPPTCISLKGM